LGDDFPIFRFRNVGHHGDLQIGIEACVWAVFNFKNVPRGKYNEISELVNADYYVGIPLTYAFDQWSFRGRIYHISSHLGDEFLINHPEFLLERKNPSNVRLYGGVGTVFHSSESFKIKPLYVQYGIELRFFGKKFPYHRLYGTPFFAAHFENWQQHHWDIDGTYKLGYEISKLQGIGRKMRLFIDYHHGFSYEGQFFNERTQYGEVGFSWGF
jgi:hypothetical protein